MPLIVDLYVLAATLHPLSFYLSANLFNVNTAIGFRSTTLILHEPPPVASTPTYSSTASAKSPTTPSPDLAPTASTQYRYQTMVRAGDSTKPTMCRSGTAIKISTTLPP